jgi:hypothetical protein
VDALYKEFSQLNAKGLFQPMHSNNLSLQKEIGFTSQKSYQGEKRRTVEGEDLCR